MDLPLSTTIAAADLLLLAARSRIVPDSGRRERHVNLLGVLRDAMAIVQTLIVFQTVEIVFGLTKLLLERAKGAHVSGTVVRREHSQLLLHKRQAETGN